MFVHLGIGEYGQVIKAVLEINERIGLPLPPRLVDQVLVWVDGYSSHTDYRHLRELVMMAALG